MGIVRILFVILIAIAAYLIGPLPASAEKRVALVIGNGAYQKVGKLPNAANDAKAIAGMLQSAGFDEVALYENLGIRELRRAIGDFAGVVRDADFAIVYYSGHGIEVNGINYLIPIDAVLQQDIDVPYETFSLENLIQILEPARKLRLVMLDACRDNPFARSMKRTIGSRAVGRGLAAVEPTTVNTVIGYAAKAGSVAYDGDGANSPYAVALLNNLAIPGLDLRIAFGRVRDDVLKATGNRQEPFIYGSLGGANVSIVDAAGSAPTNTSTLQVPAAPIDRAAQAWSIIQNTTSIAVLEDYVRQFGSTTYGSMARARLEELKRAQVAVGPPVAPPVPPITKPAVGVFSSKLAFSPLSAERERALNPKDTFKECDACPEMLVVPAGSFTMGSPESELGRDKDESPQHQVTFAQSFAAGRFAVTFAEWDTCVADGGCNGYGPSDQGWGRDRQPVINVSWEDAQAYAAWISKRTGKSYRLLSEAEREYVTRAGTSTPFWWGMTISPQQANYDGTYTYNNGPTGAHRELTVAVDSFRPNPWGLYQVHGNIWEWTGDCYNGSYNGAPGNGAAWTSGNCGRRVVRGGSWSSGPRSLRAALRDSRLVGLRDSVLGFRVARTLGQ